MISHVSGVIRHIGLDRVVVEVGGVGLGVLTTPATAAAQRHGADATLSTSLVVREDSLTLYGFLTEDEKELFETVQTVSGVGPRLALAMLAVSEPDALRAAIAGGDVRALTRIPGIGKKGAERIVLELRDKIGAPRAGAAGPSAPTPAVGDAGRDQVREALVGLGWNVKQADAAMEQVLTRDGESLPVPLLLKAALRELGR